MSNPKNETTPFPGITPDHLFPLKYPHLRHMIPELLGVYATCQWKELAGKNPASLDEVYNHIYADHGGCEWCRRELDVHIKYQSTFSRY